VAFVFVTVMLDMLALGMIIPVLPKLVVAFAGGDTAHGAEIFGLIGAIWALMQFLFSPIQGALSDRFGRRPVILLSNLGLGLDYIVMALAPDLTWLIVGRIGSGIASASVSTAFAYIADVTPPARRAASFGLIGVAFGVGFVLGPAAGGLLGGIDPRLPFWVAGGLSLANALYGLVVLPESLPRERRAPFSWRRANPLGSLKLLRTYPQLFGLAGIHFLGQLAHVVLSSATVLYVSYRYDWDEPTVGLMLAAVGVCSAVVQGGLVGRAVARFGERRVLLAGLLFGAAGLAIFGLANTGTLFMIGVPVMTLWGLSGPALQGLMTQRVQPNEQGQLQGAASSLQGIANMVGPFLFTEIFALSIGDYQNWHLPGATFLFASVLVAGSAAIAWRITRPS
jgi:DHA1 family tetracycline resistance protein-like MFS transporter